MGRPDPISELSELHLIERATEQVLAKSQMLLHIGYHVVVSYQGKRTLLAEAIRRRALALAIDESYGLDEKWLLGMLQANVAWTRIVEAIPMHETLKPEFCWYLLRTALSASQWRQYLTRNPQAPQRAPFAIEIAVARSRTTSLRYVTASLRGLAVGEPDLRVKLQ